MSKRIYIGLSKPKKVKLFSFLISLILGKPYSHCYIRWKTSWGFDAVYEASGFSIKFVGGDIWHDRNKIYKEWPIDISLQKYHSTFLPYLMRISGTQYGFVQIVGILIALIFKLKHNPFGDKNKKMVCSELVYYILTEVFKKNWDSNPDIVTPKDIERYLDGNT